MYVYFPKPITTLSGSESKPPPFQCNLDKVQCVTKMWFYSLLSSLFHFVRSFISGDVKSKMKAKFSSYL